MKNNDTYTADELNAHLKSGGVVQVTTYLKSTVYTSKHAGWFSTSKGGALLVQSGNSKVRLSLDDGKLLVAIRLGRYVEGK